MDFKTPYLLALAERDPKLFMELRRSGQMDDHLRQKQLQANELKELLLAQYPHPSMAEVREAEEQVFATLIDFPSAEDEEESPGRPDHLSLAGEGFPLTEDDFRGTRAIAKLLRSRLAMMTPAELRSLAALLLALERLPCETPGVDISLTLSQPNLDGNYGWADLYISQTEFRLGIGEHFYDPSVGGDTESQTLYEACAGDDAAEGDIELWLSYAEARSADGSVLIEDNSDLEEVDWGTDRNEGI